MGIFLAVLCMGLSILVPPSNAGENDARRNLDTAPHGLIGATGGFSLHAGRTTRVDATSGASASKDIDNWLEPAGTAGLMLDLGVPTSPLGLDGTVGVRFQLDGSFPGPYYEIDMLARYRFKIDTGREILRSVEPWFGAGVAFAFVDEFSSDMHVQFPFSVGCDLQLGGRDLYLVTQVDVNTINPIAPKWHNTEGDTFYWNTARYNNYKVKVGIAYRFY